MWEESLLQSNFSVALPNCVPKKKKKKRGNQNLQPVDKTQEPQTEGTLEA